MHQGNHTVGQNERIHIHKVNLVTEQAAGQPAPSHRGVQGFVHFDRKKDTREISQEGLHSNVEGTDQSEGLSVAT